MFSKYYIRTFCTVNFLLSMVFKKNIRTTFLGGGGGGGGVGGGCGGWLVQNAPQWFSIAKLLLKKWPQLFTWVCNLSIIHRVKIFK